MEAEFKKQVKKQLQTMGTEFNSVGLSGVFLFLYFLVHPAKNFRIKFFSAFRTDAVAEFRL